VLDAVALPATERGRCEDAARLLGYTDHWYRAHDDNRQANEARIEQLARDVATTALGEARFRLLANEGESMPEREASFWQRKLRLLCDQSWVGAARGTNGPRVPAESGRWSRGRPSKFALRRLIGIFVRGKARARSQAQALSLSPGLFLHRSPPGRSKPGKSSVSAI